MASSKSYLIVKFGALGDLFYALPAVHALRSQTPDSEISWIVDEALGDVLESVPEIDRLVKVPGGFYRASTIAKLRILLRLRRQLPRQLDGILLFHRHWVYLLFLLGKGPIHQIRRPVKSRLERFGNWFLKAFFDVHPVPFPPLKKQESLALKAVTESLVGAPIPDWKINSQTWRLPKSANRLPGKSILIHTGGGNNLKTEFELKRWPGFLPLAEKLAQIPGTRLTLIGSAAEREEAEAWLTENSQSGITSLVGKTNLIELVSVIRDADLVIGPDSGPLHIADQLGVPVFGVYGPTSEISWGLIGSSSKIVFRPVPCHPCYKDDGYFPPCPYQHRCMKELSVDQVHKEVLSFMGNTSSASRGLT